MKLKTFFEQFDQFANATDAVAKMRELVLELSATGRLIPEALERPVEKDTKLMGSIVELVMGQAPAGDEYNTEGRGTVFVKVGEFGPLYPREEVWTTNPLKFAKKGDVLVCVVGATVGKLNLAIDCAIGRSAAAIRPSPALDTKFLYYSLVPYTLRLRRNSRGSAQGVIGKAELNAVSLWVPSRQIQKRLVAKVDELMALCDQLEAQQGKRETRHVALARASLARFADAPTPTNLDFLFHKSYTIPPADLRKSILTLAVQGKLVPQDPNDEEPEFALLELHRARILKSKAGNLRAAKVPDNAFLEESIPFIPDSWRTVSFDHVAVAHNNALKAGPFGSALKKEFYAEKGYKIYGQEQVIAGDPFIGDYYIDEKKFTELESCAVTTGDILISLVGTIGKILVLPDGVEPGIINPRVIKLSLDGSLVYPMFIKVLIGSPYAVDFFEKNSHGGTMNILNLSILRALPLPLPPLAEQRRIVAKVDQLMALVDQLETQLTASRATAANLLSALVAELTTRKETAHET